MSGPTTGVARAMPPQMRDAVRRLWQRRVTRTILLVVLFWLPATTFVSDRAGIFAWALTSALVGLSMNVLAGYAGQISLAHAALWGTGAFTLGSLTTKYGVPWLVSLPLAGVVTALIALVIGFPALRIRGLQLAIATLGFQFAMQRVFFRAEFFGGSAGVHVTFPTFFGVQLDERTFIWVVLSVVVLVWMLDRNLTRSRAGRAFLALRQDEQVASSFGIPVARYKLLAFAISGFYAGLAGALFGTLQEDVTNELFEYIISFEFLVFAVLGGLGSRAGTAVGSAFPVIYRQLLDFLRAAGPMLGGVLLVATLLRHQGGMAEQGREIGHIAQLFAKKRLVGIAAFLAAIAVSLAVGITVPWVLGWIASRLVRAIGFRYDFTSATWFILSLAGIAATFQIVVRRLAAKLFGAAAAGHGAAPTNDGEDAEPVTVRLSQAQTMAAAGFRRDSVAPPTTAPLLEVENISKIFGGVRALDGVSMTVNQGELIGIMGPNGSGKTTLLNNISGFLTPNGGDIRFRGRSVLKMGPHQRAALGIGRTFQNIGLVKSETVFDNFVIAQHLVCNYGPMEGLLRTGGVVKEELRLRARAQMAIELLGLQDIVNEEVRSLPHGLAKLVELGCALVTGPELLLLDEPAAGVSPQEADALGETLKTIAANFGVTILMIEHHVPLMLQTCDYIYVLNFGQLLTHGEPNEVAAHPDVIAAYLGSVGKEASLAVAGTH